MENVTSYLIQPTVTTPGEVRAWEEIVELPTYVCGEEEKNPVFLEKRVYQGSSGSVYPYAVIEKINDRKENVPYKALFIENEYLKIMILPELGGRVQMAYDKVRQRHFVYYNQVIKPALVGLTGPWISGGIEFNWPQHHRPSTYLPTESLIENNEDGSVTVWCNEVERMFRTKGMQGFTLHPGKAYLEIKVKVYNRTPFPQTFLWWANPAVAVNDAYKSVFPPDVHAVFDHGKRDVSKFPIATGIYYKHDYSAGVDISKYKNIPVPTSYMAIRSKYDFVGGYEDDSRSGLLHVANHHLSPGKKQWTWGCGDFGVAWDRNLTDEDGPYIELMTGVYTDNQPDFTWLQPYEEKSWVQYFMPYAEVGYVKNATKDAVVNVETAAGATKIILYTTSEYTDMRLTLGEVGGKLLFDSMVNSAPGRTFETTVATGAAKAEELEMHLYDSAGGVMLSYKAEAPRINPIPDPAKAAEAPADIASIEQLYLTGLHLEQYRHATYDPLDYYTEALRREPGDVRCNNAVGLLCMRKGMFAEAEQHFRRAVSTLTERNPNPYEGEPYYNLGWSLKMQGRMEEAYEAFYKAAWNAAWQDPAYLGLAQIDAGRGNLPEALRLVEAGLVRNWHNHKARHLQAAILRKMNLKESAAEWIDDSLAIDRFNIGCLFEKFLLSDDRQAGDKIRELLQDKTHAYIEYALDYAAAGLYGEARAFLEKYLSHSSYPIVHYALGYFADMAKDGQAADKYYRSAADADPDKCFPNRIEEVVILSQAIDRNPDDANAPYYLGNFLYAARRHEDAIKCWECSLAKGADMPVVWRNLALAYYNKKDKKKQAVCCMEKAFKLDNSDARIFMELDQLYKRMCYPCDFRLELLKRHMTLVEQRDDLYVELATLCNTMGLYEEAKEMIARRRFHPWEGGEGKVTGQYVICRLELAKQAMCEGKFDEALRLLEETDSFPHNLGEGKLANAEENEIHYYKGLACRGLGQAEKAAYYFGLATKGSAEPRQAFFYNDQQPDKIYFQGLAWRQLGDEDKARSRFNKLIEHGEKHLFDDCKIDYFAVSLPDLAIWEDDLNKRNAIHCYYVMALGYGGLNDIEKANRYYEKIKELDIYKQLLNLK